MTKVGIINLLAKEIEVITKGNSETNSWMKFSGTGLIV